MVELLYLWSTKELKGETKIGEAYSMLKKQGIVQEDPVYVGDAVFASGVCTTYILSILNYYIFH